MLSDGDAAGDHDVDSAPDVVADDGGAPPSEPLPEPRSVGVVEPVVGIRDEAAGSDPAVLSDLDVLVHDDHHTQRELGVLADAQPPVEDVDPDVRLEVDVRSEVDAALS